MGLSSGTGPVPLHYPERGMTLDNGATVIDVNEDSGTLIAVSPTGSFAVWEYQVRDTKTTTTRGHYFSDLRQAVDYFTGSLVQ